MCNWLQKIFGCNCGCKCGKGVECHCHEEKKQPAAEVNPSSAAPSTPVMPENNGSTPEGNTDNIQ